MQPRVVCSTPNQTFTCDRVTWIFHYYYYLYVCLLFVHTCWPWCSFPLFFTLLCAFSYYIIYDTTTNCSTKNHKSAALYYCFYCYCFYCFIETFSFVSICRIMCLCVFVCFVCYIPILQSFLLLLPYIVYFYVLSFTPPPPSSRSPLLVLTESSREDFRTLFSVFFLVCVLSFCMIFVCYVTDNLLTSPSLPCTLLCNSCMYGKTKYNSRFPFLSVPYRG